jgi:hypothetical protein
MFRATWSVSGRDVLIVVALASCARESRELVRDVAHHGRTSAGHTHCHSMLSQRLGQPGRERAFVVLFLSCGCMGRASCLRLRSLSGAVGPTGAYPGNRNRQELQAEVSVLRDLICDIDYIIADLVYDEDFFNPRQLTHLENLNEVYLEQLVQLEQELARIDPPQ